MENSEKKIEKQKITTNQKITRWCAAFVFGVIGIALIYTLIYNLTKPAPDYDNFKLAMRNYLATNENISDIVIKDNDTFDVIIKDNWFTASEIDKLRFCQNVHDTIFVYADKYNLIDGDNENVYLYFYDTTGINVAKQGFNGFEILH